MIKVVVVDDDTDLLDMVCLMLATPRIKPYCFDDCKRIMSVLEAEAPDVLVMDIFLGDCDGRSLCKQLRATEKYARLPVVLYSAGEITNASVQDCGASFFLRKPFEMQALLDKVHQLAPS